VKTLISEGHELPSYSTYTDHLTPLPLLALNTGCRRGELLALTWADVEGTMLTVHGASAKSERSLRRVWQRAQASPLLWIGRDDIRLNRGGDPAVTNLQALEWP
jgi:integrase